MGKHVVHGALGAAGLLGLLLLWWLGVHVFGQADGLSARFSPEATLASLVELLGQAEVYEHVWVSLKPHLDRFAAGVVDWCAAGVAGGQLSSPGVGNLASVSVPAHDLAAVVDLSLIHI